MPYSCLDYAGELPTIVVAEVCLRDTVGRAAFRAQGIVAELRPLGLPDGLLLAGASLAGVILVLRLLALLDAVGRAARRGWSSATRWRKRPAPQTLVERHRGRPAEADIEPVDPS